MNCSRRFVALISSSGELRYDIFALDTQVFIQINNVYSGETLCMLVKHHLQKAYLPESFGIL